MMVAGPSLRGISGPLTRTDTATVTVTRSLVRPSTNPRCVFVFCIPLFSSSRQAGWPPAAARPSSGGPALPPAPNLRPRGACWRMRWAPEHCCSCSEGYITLPLLAAASATAAACCLYTCCCLLIVHLLLPAFHAPAAARFHAPVAASFSCNCCCLGLPGCLISKP